MTSPDAPSAPPPPPKSQTFGSWLRTMPRWKKIAVAAAVVTIVVAGVMSSGAVATGSGGGGGSGNLSGLNASLVDGQRTLESGQEPAAKGVFRLGFSFLAGFCIGSFIRATLKVAAIAFGFWLFLTMVLSYYGIMTVDWSQMDSLWSRFSGNVEREWGSFQTFMTGSLPAAGLAITGLAVGLKRH